MGAQRVKAHVSRFLDDKSNSKTRAADGAKWLRGWGDKYASHDMHRFTCVCVCVCVCTHRISDDSLSEYHVLTHVCILTAALCVCVCVCVLRR